MFFHSVYFKGNTKIVTRNNPFIQKNVCYFDDKWYQCKLETPSNACEFAAIIYCYYGFIRGFIRIQLPSVFNTVKFTMEGTTLTLNLRYSEFSNDILFAVSIRQTTNT